MADDVETVEVTLAYAGRRMSGTKVLYAYAVVKSLVPEEELRYWGKKLRDTKIGGTFTADRVVDGNPESFSLRGASEPGRNVISYVPQSIITAWQAEDAAAATMLAKIALDRKTKNAVSDPLEYHLSELGKAYAKIGSFAARAAFIEYVTAKVGGGR